MKRLYQLKRSLLAYQNRVAMNKEKLANKNNSKKIKDYARWSIPRYEKKILLIVKEIEKRIASSKRVERVKVEKPAIIRPAKEMPIKPEQWLKPLSERTGKVEKSFKPVIFG